jgi:hypothetical protein
VKKGRTLGETHEIKCVAIGNILGNTLGIWGTPWELYRNPKKPQTLPLPKLKRKKLGLPLSMLNILIGHM